MIVQFFFFFYQHRHCDPPRKGGGGQEGDRAQAGWQHGWRDKGILTFFLFFSNLSEIQPRTSLFLIAGLGSAVCRSSSLI